MLKKLLSALGAVAIVIAAVIGGGLGRFIGQETYEAVAPSRPSEQQIEDGLAKGFRVAAEKANEELPKMVDKVTRLDNVTVGPGPRIVYHHTFPNYSPKSSEITAARTAVEKNVCSNTEMKPSLQYGGIYVYSYSSRDGVELARFEFDRNSCGYAKASP